MFGRTRWWIRSGLLFGGLLCLALAAHSAARAAELPRGDSGKTLVKKLEEAVKVRDGRAVAAILADTPENQGREELLAVFAEYQAAGVLEYVLDEHFEPGELIETKSWWKTIHIEVESDPVVCGIATLQLHVAWNEDDGSTTTRELAAYLDPDGTGLVLPEGLFGLSPEDSAVVTDLSRYKAKLYEKTIQELSEGKFQSREEVFKALADDLRQAEPMQRYVAQIAGPALARAVAGAIDAAFKKVLIDAVRKAGGQ